MTYNEWLNTSCYFQQVVKEIDQLEGSYTKLRGHKNRRIRWETKVKVRRLRLKLYKLFVDNNFCGQCIKCLETKPAALCNVAELFLEGDIRSYHEL